MKNAFYWMCRFVLMILLKIFFRFKCTGRKYLPKTGGCIIASNHLSYLDPIVLSVASTRILTFMAKRELFEQNWFFTWLITMLNSFPLEREKTDVKALRLAMEKLNKGHSMIIFPEGTRSRTGDVKNAQAGVSMLAANSKVKVVPTLIIGTDQAMGAKAKKLIFFVPLSVHFGQAMDMETYRRQNPNLDKKKLYLSFSQKIIDEIRFLKDEYKKEKSA
ncbi:MAG: lysophospholipid acyltransferase family protein [Candidatus Omnitrophota bacterium]